MSTVNVRRPKCESLTTETCSAKTQTKLTSSVICALKSLTCNSLYTKKGPCAKSTTRLCAMSVMSNCRSWMLSSATTLAVMANTSTHPSSSRWCNSHYPRSARSVAESPRQLVRIATLLKTSNIMNGEWGLLKARPSTIVTAVSEIVELPRNGL